jgi:hypothetical protein
VPAPGAQRFTVDELIANDAGVVDQLICSYFLIRFSGTHQSGAVTSLTLVRDMYSSDFQLVLTHSLT